MVTEGGENFTWGFRRAPLKGLQLRKSRSQEQGLGRAFQARENS